jgi:Holliday junction resolvase
MRSQISKGPTERSIVERLKRRLRETGKVVKLHGGPYQEAGLPDLLYIEKGCAYCIEVKTHSAFNREKHGLSELQHKQLTGFAQAGAVCTVTDGERWVLINENGEFRDLSLDNDDNAGPGAGGAEPADQ